MNGLNGHKSKCTMPPSDRRKFLQLLTAGGAAGLVAGCADTTPLRTHFKDTAPFIAHGRTNLETRLGRLEGFLTPIEEFFVRNNDVSLDLRADTYRLEVAGDAVGRPLSLSYQDIRALPSRTVFSYLECGGNQRAFFGKVLGQTAQGTQWGRGAVGMAVWTGVSLRDVLRRAEILPSAKNVQLVGLDQGAPEEGFRRPLPIEKAQEANTLLAYRMNGAVLPRDHGFPLRAVVPGWVGSSSIKWLGRIEVTTGEVWSRNNTTSYVLVGEDYAPEGRAPGKVAILQSIKSVLAQPWPAALREGQHILRGYAYSPHAAIESVRWSADDGASFQTARMLEPPWPYAWARFELTWEARRGDHVVTTIARDQAGNEQPATIPYNAMGYLFNMPLPHPIRVEP